MRVALVVFLVGLVSAAPQGDPGTTTPAPVAILKQVNKINLDGSYTYGFEAEDGTFRVETRDASGKVKGKFGYLDETGELKVVEYHAGTETGFSAGGKHLPVAPAPLAPLPAVASFSVPAAAPVVPVVPAVQRQVVSAVPVAVPTGNFNDEFGTDEDFQSVDADEDGIPDTPRSRVPVAAVPAFTRQVPQLLPVPQVPVNFFQPQSAQLSQVSSGQVPAGTQQLADGRFFSFQPVQPQVQAFPFVNPAFFQAVPQGQQ